MSMEDTINRNILKYACGKAIDCPICSAILDWRQGVLIDDDEHGLSVLCGRCWMALPETTRATVRKRATVTTGTGVKE